MGKPYSMDLRTRLVSAVEGGVSRNEAARRFGVAVSTAINWVRRKQQTGSVLPSQMGGYKPRSIRGEHEAWLLDRLKRGDYTLRGLVAEFGERGLKVDYRSVWTFVHEQGQSFKKNRARQRTRSSRRRAPARAVGDPSEPD
jgi:transposase